MRADEVSSGTQEGGAVKMTPVGVLAGLLALGGLIRQRDRVCRSGRTLSLVRVDGRDVGLRLLLGRVRHLNCILNDGSDRK